MRYHPPPGVSLGLSLAKSLLVGVALALALGLGVSVTERADQSSSPGIAAEPARADRLMERYECSATGFASDVMPNGALITLEGRVRRVSFDRGWAVFTGEQPGALMAVCLR